MTIKSIDLAWIVVKDFQSAVKYYTEVVGLQLMEKNDEFGWAELQGENGARLGIAQTHEMNRMGPGENAVVTFSVDNIENVKAEMEKKGAVCIGDIHEIPGHVKMQMVRDPDGNQFQLVETLSN